MTICDLSNKNCLPCQEGDRPALSAAEATDYLAKVPGWDLNEAATEIHRHFTFKGFAKAVYMANAVAHLSDQTGHHADVRFGWGYCEVTYTTHEIGGLSENDFVCAAKLNARVEI